MRALLLLPLALHLHAQQPKRIIPVPPATADISGLETELRKQQYYVVTLRDADAKRPAIREKLRDLSNLVKADGGTILFYFSGHGGAGSDGANYLAAYETPSSQLAEEGFAVAEVERLLRESRAQRQIMLIDACRNVPPQPGLNKASAPASRHSSPPRPAAPVTRTPPSATASSPIS
jgi:hypothetical protein